VVSTVSTQPAMVADELRRQADEFVDLAHLIPKIGRDPSERAARAASGEYADRGERLERPRLASQGGLERRYGIRQAPSTDDNVSDS
jgi:hypothetical protein